MRYLAEAGLFAFYYVSHAPFLFAFRVVDSCRQVRERMLSFGLPDDRFETHEIAGSQHVGLDRWLACARRGQST